MPAIPVNVLLIFLIATKVTNTYDTSKIPLYNDDDKLELLEYLQNETRLSDKEGVVNLPVDFFHIFKHGYGDDPQTGMKAPVDLLALDMAMARAFNIKYKESPIQRKPMRGYYVNPSGKLGFHSPNFKPTERPVLKKNKTVLLDIEEALDRNLRNPPTPRPNTLMNYNQQPAVDFTVNASTFDFTGQLEGEYVNFTTCDEFAQGAYFHPEETTGVDWIPFYVWSRSFYTQAVKHLFNIPTIRSVDDYKARYDKYLERRINWEYPKLELKVEDRGMMLIAIDRSGLFYGIPHLEFPEDLPEDFYIPLVQIRLKIIEPYLAMMYCEGPHIFLMAVLGSEPKIADEKISEAKAVGIRGIGAPLFRDLKAEKIRLEQEADIEKQIELRKYLVP